MIKRGMNKKGAEPIVWLLIVVGLAILLFLIMTYVLGIDVLGAIKKIVPSRANVDSIVQNCLTSCNGNQQIDFCCTEREVKFKDGEKSSFLRCNDDERFKGDCKIDCEDVDCSIRRDSIEAFKAFCKKNCKNDDGKKEKEFCCTENRVPDVEGKVTCDSSFSKSFITGSKDIILDETTCDKDGLKIDCEDKADKKMCPATSPTIP